MFSKGDKKHTIFTKWKMMKDEQAHWNKDKDSPLCRSLCRCSLRFSDLDLLVCHKIGVSVSLTHYPSRIVPDHGASARFLAFTRVAVWETAKRTPSVNLDLPELRKNVHQRDDAIKTREQTKSTRNKYAQQVTSDQLDETSAQQTSCTGIELVLHHLLPSGSNIRGGRFHA